MKCIVNFHSFFWIRSMSFVSNTVKPWTADLMWLFLLYKPTYLILHKFQLTFGRTVHYGGFSFRVINNIPTKAALKFGSEAWVLKKREEQRLEAAQMKFLRHLPGITKLDKENYQCIREKTGAQNIVKEIEQYQKKWLQHVQRMDRNRLPRQVLKYRPEGRRNIGRPKKRWRDQLHFED